MIATETSNFTCGNIYKGHPVLTNQPVDWTWFKCLQTRKCIHIESRCDLHPSTECIYEKNGILVAEDEEGCFDIYKKKGLIANSAKFICQSPFHNTEIPAILSNVTYWVYEWYNFKHDGYWYSNDKFNATIIPEGTTVEIWATRCNGVAECWNNEDEEGCGLGPWETTSIGDNHIKRSYFSYVPLFQKPEVGQNSLQMFYFLSHQGSKAPLKNENGKLLLQNTFN
jgi:hypothetical protein